MAARVMSLGLNSATSSTQYSLSSKCGLVHVPRRPAPTSSFIIDCQRTRRESHVAASVSSLDQGAAGRTYAENLHHRRKIRNTWPGHSFCRSRLRHRSACGEDLDIRKQGRFICLGYRAQGQDVEGHVAPTSNNLVGDVCEAIVLSDVAERTLLEAETEPVEDQEKKGSLWGAVALITGTSVGAGILALPARTAEAGFVPFASILLGCWCLLVLEALLLAEVNVALMKQKEERGEVGASFVSLRTMAEDTLGPWGGLGATVTYTLLSYALMVAYLAKSADVLSLLSGAPQAVTGTAFLAAVLALVIGGGPPAVDWVNQWLTSSLLGLFFLIVLVGASMADWATLEYMDWSMAPQALPVIFLALVYHDLIPVICSYFKGDLSRIRVSLVLGSALPLTMFLTWDAVALSLVTYGTRGEDPLVALMSAGSYESAGPAVAVRAFSFLAVATSFLGSALGLSEFILEQVELFLDRARSAGSSSASKGQADVASTTATAMSASQEMEGRRPTGDEQVELFLDRARSPGSSSASKGQADVASTTAMAMSASQDMEGRSSTGDGSGETEAGPSSMPGQERQHRGGAAEVRESLGAWWLHTRQGLSKISSEALEKLTGREVLTFSSYGMVMLPPLYIALTTPDAFLRATDIAGAYGMTTLYGIFPPLMAWGLFSRQLSADEEVSNSVEHPESLQTSSSNDNALSWLPGARFALTGLGACALSIMVMQAVSDVSSVGASGSIGNNVVLASGGGEAIGDASETMISLVL